MRTPTVTLGKSDWAKGTSISGSSWRRPKERTLWKTPTICQSTSWPQFGQAGNDLLDREALFERVQAFQILPNKLLIDHRDTHAGRGVLVGERPAAHNTNTEGFEVVRGDGLEGSKRPLGEINHRPTHHGKWHSVAGPEQRRAGD